MMKRWVRVLVLDGSIVLRRAAVKETMGSDKLVQVGNAAYHLTLKGRRFFRNRPVWVVVPGHSKCMEECPLGKPATRTGDGPISTRTAHFRCVEDAPHPDRTCALTDQALNRALNQRATGDFLTAERANHGEAQYALFAAILAGAAAALSLLIFLQGGS